jgi:hypothetical protein
MQDVLRILGDRGPVLYGKIWKTVKDYFLFNVGELISLLNSLDIIIKMLRRYCLGDMMVKQFISLLNSLDIIIKMLRQYCLGDMMVKQ